MPFPPGVGERSSGEIGNSENYEVITADRAIDESNVGNRILRNMGWQEGLVRSSPTYFSISLRCSGLIAFSLQYIMHLITSVYALLFLVLLQMLRRKGLRNG
jgi:hypothetical protein